MIVVMCSALAVGSASAASGTVFDDRDGDGVRSAGEPGVAHALVSDGRRIVEADAGGVWRLDDAEPGRPLFVLPRRGWTTPVGPQQLPHFHARAGEEPVHFALRRYRVGDDFSVLVFGETQPSSIEQIDLLSADVIGTATREAGHAFGLSLGDVVSDRLDLFEPVNEAIALLGLPSRNIAGNHDFDFEAPDDLASIGPYEAVYGPSSYAFQVGAVHFVLLDDVVYRGKAFRDELRANRAQRPGERAYVGGFREDQFEFIEAYLDFRTSRSILRPMGGPVPLGSGLGSSARCRSVCASLPIVT